VGGNPTDGGGGRARRSRRSTRLCRSSFGSIEEKSLTIAPRATAAADDSARHRVRHRDRPTLRCIAGGTMLSGAHFAASTGHCPEGYSGGKGSRSCARGQQKFLSSRRRTVVVRPRTTHFVEHRERRYCHGACRRWSVSLFGGTRDVRSKRWGTSQTPRAQPGWYTQRLVAIDRVATTAGQQTVRSFSAGFRRHAP
jgi:hypothetical protein